GPGLHDRGRQGADRGRAPHAAFRVDRGARLRRQRRLPERSPKSRLQAAGQKQGRTRRPRRRPAHGGARAREAQMDVTLHTRRLVLRHPVSGDAPRIVRFLDNFAVAGKLSRVPYPYRLADAEWWLGTRLPANPAGETSFAIDLPGEGLIGLCGFHADEQGTVIGYWLGEPFWNRGFMSEAAAAVVAWYFETTPAEHLG